LSRNKARCIEKHPGDVKKWHDIFSALRRCEIYFYTALKHAQISTLNYLNPFGELLNFYEMLEK
jgi:hypothetical protein